jgi:AcrR family transcriptional regulator
VKESRKYEMRRRAERQDETRRRIVEATVALHEEQGVIRTTISDVATRAGVERATVYRHFPDERALITACTGHYSAQHPLPNPTPWLATADPVARLRLGLTEIYAYHRRTERMSSRTAPDLREHPVLQEVIAPMAEQWGRVHEALVSGWETRDVRFGRIVAATGHAMAFSTWQSLVREQGLADEDAVEVMVALVRCLSTSRAE